jgi:5'-nucleotidase
VKPEPQNHIDNNAIFANNYLNFEDVKVVGFDMDYTLVQYTIELQQLIYTLARDMLTNVYGYPKTLSGFNFDPKFAIRGLSVDKRNGNYV